VHCVQEVHWKSFAELILMRAGFASAGHVCEQNIRPLENIYVLPKCTSLAVQVHVLRVCLKGVCLPTLYIILDRWGGKILTLQKLVTSAIWKQN